jgi:hypothetical protein
MSVEPPKISIDSDPPHAGASKARWTAFAASFNAVGTRDLSQLGAAGLPAWSRIITSSTVWSDCHLSFARAGSRRGTSSCPSR